MELHTKQQFTEALMNIINPLKNYYTSSKSGLKIGVNGVKYGEKIAGLEGFARVLWGLAPLWAGGGADKDFENIYLTGIINGTNKNHPDYWGDFDCANQRMVEMAAIGYALLMAPEKIWKPLDETQKNNLEAWLLQINNCDPCDNNWRFFPVLVNLGLKNVGADYSEQVIKHSLERIHSFYVGDGWYNDGAKGVKRDYYVAFAIHFYSLLYAKSCEKSDPENSRIFKERAMLFAKDFIYWFDEKGRGIAFGRSMTYRFAQVCFWSACVFADVYPFDMGTIKGIITRNIGWWLERPIFTEGGFLSVGYEYPLYNMAEGYNSPQSPYWALKSFMVLSLDDTHPFWSTASEALPELEKIKVIEKANMIIQRYDDYAVACTAGQYPDFNFVHIAEKTSKLLYSSKYSFSVPRSYFKLEQAATDNMLTFVADDMCFVRRKCDYVKVESNSIYSVWKPHPEITVETEIILTSNGHMRKHKVKSNISCKAYDCHFAATETKPHIESDCGQFMLINCEANTNLSSSQTVIQAMEYNVNPGENYFESSFSYF